MKMRLKVYLLAFLVVLHYYGPSGLADGKIEGGFLSVFSI